MTEAIDDEIEIDSPFSGFSITEDDEPDSPSAKVDSPFIITVDSLEQQPYTFQNINGDYRDDNSPINVRTVRKRLKTGDYAICGMPGICIERKSKPDLYSSMSDSTKRDNFIGRLRRIQEEHNFGAVLIEAYPTEIINDPPFFTSLNPKTIIRSVFSWSQQFPLCHWYFAEDRDMAEQMCYRILEKFYQHKTESKYIHHNRPIEENVEAFRLGILTRRSTAEYELPHCLGNPLRVSWLKGWNFASTHFFGGDLGTLHEPGSVPTDVPSKSKKAKIKAEEAKFKPLPGQRKMPMFADPDADLGGQLMREFDATIKKKTKKS